MKFVMRKPDVPQVIKSTFHIEDLFKTIKFKYEFDLRHPDYFQPYGTIVFCGPQGSGKTLSAVRMVKHLLEVYPECQLVSNVTINGYEDRTFSFDGVDCFRKYRNGEKGVIFFIDEIHILFNSLESKGANINIFEVVSQQRKQRMLIVGTSQVFNRMQKPFREQFRFVVLCRNFFNSIQWNRLADAQDCTVDETSGKVNLGKTKIQFFFHSPEMYESYDTTALIDRDAFNYDFTVKEAKSLWMLT